MIPRLARPDELRLVRSSWLQSYASSDFARWLTGARAFDEHHKAAAEYWTAQRRVIEFLLAHALVTVIEDVDVPGFVAAWCCAEPSRAVVHYVYVKQHNRGAGYARALLGDLATRDAKYTHRSRGLDAKRLPVGWRFEYAEIWRAPVGATAEGDAA